MTSEIKPAAIKALTTNFGPKSIRGDITTVDCSEIPDFDFLLAGFPCQAFSVAGRQRGFLDTRGTLFFEVERILREKRPYGFILENVEGLVTHDRENPEDKIGRTFSTILHILEDELQYQVSWKVLDSQKFGLAQSRNRIYIVGTLYEKVSLTGFKLEKKVFKDVMEVGLPMSNIFVEVTSDNNIIITGDIFIIINHRHLLQTGMKTCTICSNSFGQLKR